jgi:hypothetical protein
MAKMWTFASFSPHCVTVRDNERSTCVLNRVLVLPGRIIAWSACGFEDRD